MSFFSSCIRIIFITALAFSLCSGKAPARPVRKPPNCKDYKGRFSRCNNQVDPVCAKNGRTYYNGCVFCAVALSSKIPIKFWHYGRCK
ncbi:sperm-associated acrosin inhibitor-like [Myotis yumanensis]|uniref:sperm-associated acrosin inhibitor-like n=1 Tax=Myotis yumanensis TaxID=159337 RepID=UPI0038D2032E